MPEESSEQSGGELVVYLDPDDYKEEFRKKSPAVK